MDRSVLVVEDNEVVAMSLTNSIRKLGMKSLRGRTGSDAKRLLEHDQPDIAILDYWIPNSNGLDVLEWLRGRDDLTHTIVVMYSNAHEKAARAQELGAEFWRKGTHQEFEDNLRALAARLPIYRLHPIQHVFSLSVEVGRHIRVRSTLDTAGNEHSSRHVFNIESLALAAQFRADLRSPDWQILCRSHGAVLFDLLFPREIWEVYFDSLSKVSKKEERLTIRVTAPAELTGIGLEALSTKPTAEGLFLGLKCPLVWRISGLDQVGNPMNRKALNQLGRPIRVLLIASNRGDFNLSDLDFADREIDLLKALINDAFGQRGLLTEIDVVNSQEATIDNVSHKLRRGDFDIVHFAGHGVHEDSDPYKSGIVLNGGGGRQSRSVLLDCRLLAELIEHRRPEFVFLNGCDTGLQSRPSLLNERRFLGTAHGLIKAGARAVLAHRTQVRDQSACKFATDFYGKLAETGEIDLALLLARRANETDSVWISSAMYL